MAKKKRPEEVTEAFPCFFINVHSSENPRINTSVFKGDDYDKAYSLAVELVDFVRMQGGDPYLLRILNEKQEELHFERFNVFGTKKKTVPEPVKKSKTITKQGKLF